MFRVNRLLNTATGRFFISLLLGLGLATLFRKACNKRNCLVFRAPPFDKVNNKTFKHNDKCYHFKSSTVSCNNNQSKKVVEFD